MPAQFDLFAQPALPAATTQLSLFEEEEADEATPLSEAAPAAKKPRKRTAKAQGASAGGGVPVTVSLFDGYDAVEVAEAAAPLPVHAPTPVPPPPARPARATRLASPAPPALTLPFGDDEDTENAGEPSYRVLFDSTVWALRPDSGDFVHVGTGEIRDEEGFTFPNDPRADYADLPDDWDAPQSLPYR